MSIFKITALIALEKVRQLNPVEDLWGNLSAAEIEEYFKPSPSWHSKRIRKFFGHGHNPFLQNQKHFVVAVWQVFVSVEVHGRRITCRSQLEHSGRDSNPDLYVAHFISPSLSLPSC